MEVWLKARLCKTLDWLAQREFSNLPVKLFHRFPVHEIELGLEVAAIVYERMQDQKLRKSDLETQFKCSYWLDCPQGLHCLCTPGLCVSVMCLLHNIY